MTRIAVFSDIHFGKFSRTIDFSVPGEDMQDNSKGGCPFELGLVSLLEKAKPKYILIAGDLTSIGSPQEFYFCEKKILSIANKIKINKENIICCLGNHDVNWGIADLCDKHDSTNELTQRCVKDRYLRIAAGSARFCLDSFKEADEDKRGPAPYNGVYEAEDFLVFTLNSGWKCARGQQYSHGELTQEQLSWFKEITKKYREDIRKKIVLLHHHPFNYPYPVLAEDISQITEGAEFIEIATDNGIDLVVHGHRHHPIVKTTLQMGKKPITYFCAGSLAVNANHRNNGEIPNMVHFIDIDKTLDYFSLYNYSYTSAEGWKEAVWSKVTPLDYKMKLGKVFTDQENKKAVKKYQTNNTELISISWDDLDECLQFMLFNDVNNLFVEELNGIMNIFGRFPQEVCLLPKKE